MNLATTLQPILDRVRLDVSAKKQLGRPGGWRTDDPLDAVALKEHLHSGTHIRGAYPIKAGETTTSMAVFDLDDHDKVMAFSVMTGISEKLIEACNGRGLTCNPWRSSGGAGVHLILLWEDPQDAYTVRNVMAEVLTECGYRSGAKGVDYKEIEIFPKQDRVPEGRFGNQCWLPLGGKSIPLDTDLVDGRLTLGSKADILARGYSWRMSKPLVKRERPQLPVRAANTELLDGNTAFIKVRAQLAVLDPSCSYDVWLSIGMALHDATNGGLEGEVLWDEWSSQGENYCGYEHLSSKYNSFGHQGPDANVVSLKSLEFMARQHGWRVDAVALFDDISTPADEETPNDFNEELPTFERDVKGRIMASTENLYLALERPDVCGNRIGYDNFADALMISNENAPKGDGWRAFNDADYSRVKRKLENKGKAFQSISRPELKEMVHLVGSDNCFDSAVLWLSSLKWDGVPRIETFFSQYWGAANSEYSRAVSLYMWSALAGRVLSPGCQVDMVPILVGEQGEMKTSAVKALLPSADFFCEISFLEKDDDLARLMRGVLVAELSELKGLNSRDAESIKSFVTRTHEKWVPKYKEFTTTHPRRTVIIGTTNADEFLADPTGNRRWLPVEVGLRADNGGKMDMDMCKRDLTLLWAEAAVFWKKAGVAWEDAERLAKGEHAKYMITHPWEDLLIDWLATSKDICEKDEFGRRFIPNSILMSHGIGGQGRLQGRDSFHLTRVMSKLGFERTKLKGRRGWAERAQEN